MALHDVINDPAPQNTLKKASLPLISTMRTALLTVNSGNSYPNSRLETMTKQDMYYACRVHGLSVVGL